MSKEMGIKLSPGEMVAGGGLWSDLDATVTDAKFVLTTFDGKSPTPVTVLQLEVLDDAGESHEQFLSTGKGKFRPSSDGKMLVPEGEGVKLNSGSNFGLFMASMVKGGFPENRLGEDVSILVGMRAHFERVAAPKRTGLVKQARADGKVYEDTILVVTKVLQLPWDTPKTPVKGGKAPAKGKVSVAPKDSAGDTSITDEAIAAVMEVLESNPEGLTKKQLAMAVFKVVAANPNKAGIVKLVYDEEFMDAGPWSVVDGMVSM